MMERRLGPTVYSMNVCGFLKAYIFKFYEANCFAILFMHAFAILFMHAFQEEYSAKQKKQLIPLAEVNGVWFILKLAKENNLQQRV